MGDLMGIRRVVRIPIFIFFLFFIKVFKYFDPSDDGTMILVVIAGGYWSYTGLVSWSSTRSFLVFSIL